jgi:hypothetical protein
MSRTSSHSLLMGSSPMSGTTVLPKSTSRLSMPPPLERRVATAAMGGTAVSCFGVSWGNKALLRLRIEYFDQNENVAPLLPREGVVERELQLAGSRGPWFLLRLDFRRRFSANMSEAMKHLIQWRCACSMQGYYLHRDLV